MTKISEASSDFELGDSSDFGIDNGEFEIPGFSDVETVATSKDGKIKRPVTAAEHRNLRRRRRTVQFAQRALPGSEPALF